MGPDEFHEKYPGANKGGLKNNAYTNVMVVWLIDRALHIINKGLKEEDRKALLAKTGISDKEIERWQEIVHNMVIPMDKDGLIHQFEGYMDLKELDWDDYRQRYDNIHRIDRILKAEGLSPDSYKVCKQADTLMTFYVLRPDEVKEIFQRLGYPFDKKILKKNFQYYYDRCSHGSTLSMVVHAYIAGTLGIKEKTLEFFKEVLKSDLYDTQGGTTQEGIHAGVMGGSLDLFLRNFGGVMFKDGRLALNPKIPEGWKRVSFNIRYKNVWFFIEITKDQLTVKAELLGDTSFMSAAKIPVVIKNKTYQLIPGKPHTISTRMLFLI